mmetsp:Transcript_7758/g.18831  ORF Transcript_7758/g.18831 Transcript_7758/m.18831 type:complete len:292 (+) Transcript_7758:212-1087(+)
MDEHAAGCVPELHRALPAARREECTVGRERHATDCATVPFDGAPCVGRSGEVRLLPGWRLAPGGPAEASVAAVVSAQALPHLPCGSVPHAEGAVVGGGHDRAPVRRKVHGQHQVGVSFQDETRRVPDCALCDVPHTHLMVKPPAGERESVRRPRHREHQPASGDGPERGAAVCTPHHDSPVAASARKPPSIRREPERRQSPSVSPSELVKHHARHGTPDDCDAVTRSCRDALSARRECHRNQACRVARGETERGHFLAPSERVDRADAPVRPAVPPEAEQFLAGRSVPHLG